MGMGEVFKIREMYYDMGKGDPASLCLKGTSTTVQRFHTELIDCLCTVVNDLGMKVENLQEQLSDHIREGCEP